MFYRNSAASFPNRRVSLPPSPAEQEEGLPQAVDRAHQRGGPAARNAVLGVRQQGQEGRGRLEQEGVCPRVTARARVVIVLLMGTAVVSTRRARFVCAILLSGLERIVYLGFSTPGGLRVSDSSLLCRDHRVVF